MADYAGRFLTEEEKAEIVACVQKVEKSTSGEIVPMVVSESYRYPRASLVGSLAIGLFAALAVTGLLTFQQQWTGVNVFYMWVFPAVFGVAFLILHPVIDRVALLKRLFIPQAEIEEEVGEAALTSFYRRGLQHTRDQTGVLIFISVFERHVKVLADRGINEKVHRDVWQEVVEIIVRGIRSGSQAASICRAVERCGELLREHFPIKPDDRDELDNLIVED